MSEDHAKTHRVAVLWLPRVIGFDATIASLIFGYATDEAGRPLYEVITCAPGGRVVDTTLDYQMVPGAGLEALATADTVVIAGTRWVPARVDGSLDVEVAQAFTTIRPGTRMVSICTGAFVLAAAGRFDGRRVTTHWAAAQEFRDLYPGIDLDESVLFTDSGDVASSAGLAAGIDLCLHLVRSDHGAAVANRVAKHCVVPAWREGGQAQFIERSVPEPDDRSTATTRAWALENLDEPLSVGQLARHARMSSRTFSRRFLAETGVSPGAWVLERRLDLARELLESGDLSVDVIAKQAGLGSADNLRHHLRRELGMSPSAYRKTFAGK